VVPEYSGEIVFVNAITDDASAQQLASKFSFQYIPTSFFVGPSGQVTDSYSGPLSESEMRARLDKLVAE
jgi:thioredoxin-like negative regulator of GroEL